MMQLRLLSSMDVFWVCKCRLTIGRSAIESRMRSRSYILLVLLAQAFFHISAVAAYGVNVSLTARWSSTSLPLEGLEFLADVGRPDFDQGLHLFKKQRCAPDTDAGLCWEELLDRLYKLLPSSLHKLLAQHLATRHYSPRLEAFRNLFLQESLPEQAANSCAVTVVDGVYVSSAHELQTQLSNPSLSQHRPASTELIPIDHVLRTADSASAPTVILYGAPGTDDFHSAHAAIQQAIDASGQDIQYVVRPFASGGCLGRQDRDIGTWLSVGTAAPLHLAGYGAELFIKDTEYNQANEGPSNTVSASSEADETSMEHVCVYGTCAAHLTAPLEEEHRQTEDVEVKDLGLQAAQAVVNSTDPLKFLAAMTSRFPALAKGISKIKMDRAFRRALQAQSTILPPGQEFMLVNGVAVPVTDNINLAKLESVVREDAKLGHTLHSAGMHAIDVGKILALRALDRSSTTTVRLDLRSHCLWLNDLEQDAQYSDWPKWLSNFVDPANAQYGGIPKVARNALNLQLIVEPLTPIVRSVLPDVLQLYMQDLPVRIGVLFITPSAPVPDTQIGTEVHEVVPNARELFVRLFLALHETYGPEQAWQFWYLLVAMPADEEALAQDGAFAEQSSEQVMKAFEQVWGGMARQQQEAVGALKGMSASAVIQGLQMGQLGALEDAARNHTAFVESAGLQKGAHFAFNGKLSTFQGQPQEILQELQSQFDFLQRKIASRELRDTAGAMDIYEIFLDAEGFSPVYSDRVLFYGSDDGGLSAAGVASEAPQFQMASGALGLEALQRAALPYLHAPGSRDNVKPVTMWLAVDLGKAEAAALVQHAAQFITEGSAAMTRLSLLFNSAPDASAGHDQTLARFLIATMSLSSRVDKISPFLRSLSGDPELWQKLLAGGQGALDAAVAAAEDAGLNGPALKRALGEEGCCDQSGVQRTIESMHAICDALGLRRGQQAAVTNGRLIKLPDDAVLSAGEMELMQYVAYRLQPGQAVRRSLMDAQDSHRTSFQSSEGADELSSDAMSDLALLAASIAAKPSGRGSSDSDGDEQLYSVSNMHMSGLVQQVFRAELASRFRVPADPSAVVPVIQAAINPLSATGRQLSHLLQYLHTSLGADVDVILNPEYDIKSMPLQAYYAFATPQQGVTAGLASTKAHLLNVPGNKVVSTELDTDNLKLDDLGDAPGMEIGAELEAIMLTGACIDTAFETNEELHPRGTQLLLQDSRSKPLQDTIVMSNFGYFQLKTAPGNWQLDLAPGRSRDMFEMVAGDLQVLLRAERDSSAAFSVLPSSPVLVHSFSGLHMRLLLRKRQEFKGQDVLQVADKEGRVAQEGEVVNIFAIASGHMYERLQKIMVLSVLRHTNAKVKFWLIKNYMSPEMKRMMPLMAQEFGFEVEMVTYKWPSWLHRQTEKQRIIWAYKILFLDVLFPLNVSRIIFCDSDQIIRTDLAELFHMDLEGKPVAYTPFCDNNKDMDGYRFWKGGFWEKHLAGKPYHISALYLVDIDRLRQLAAGDIYRVIYDRLSKDPGSLSNLDQDLPNYAQHKVPIHSLPQEWLWCETWCGTATKAKAKTIDLCNNPATKEPKLQAARRIVAEWPEYDAQVAKFTEQARVAIALEDARSVPQSQTAPTATLKSDFASLFNEARSKLPRELLENSPIEALYAAQYAAIEEHQRRNEL